MELSENEWNYLENMVDELVNNPSKLEDVFDNRQLKKCSV
jgi:hypothetical protein